MYWEYVHVLGICRCIWNIYMYWEYVDVLSKYLDVFGFGNIHMYWDFLLLLVFGNIYSYWEYVDVLGICTCI